MAIGESKKEVRTTWIGFAVIFGGIACLLWWRERPAYPYFASASVFFAFFAATAPMALLPFYRLWVKLAGIMAWVNTRLLLAMVFYVVITPIGLIMRTLGVDYMNRKLDPQATSYWIKKVPHDDLSRYEKQY